MTFFFSASLSWTSEQLTTAPWWLSAAIKEHFLASKTQKADSRTGPGPRGAAYLRRDRSELVVAVQVEFSAVGVTAEVQRLIPVDGKAENAQEEHPYWAEEQGVELAYHSRRPEL